MIVEGTAAAEAQSAKVIAVDVDTMPQVELGHPLPLTVTLRNVGSRPVRLAHTLAPDGYPVQIRVTIANAECRKTLVALRPAAPSARSGIVTLEPGEAFRFDLPPLNRNVLYHSIWNRSGPASLQVEYVASSHDATPDGWSGSAISSPEPVTFLPPAPEEIAIQRARLESCLTTGAFSCHEVIGYFTAVRDTAAANALVALIDKHPYLYVAAKAIAAQGRAADASILESFAKNSSADAEYLGRAAAALRRELTTGCAEATVGYRRLVRRQKD